MAYQAGQFDIAVIGAGHAGIEAALAASRLGLSLALIHYQVIGLLHFFKFFFIGSLVGITNIGVRMIFSAQFSVSFFDFFIGGVPAYT